MLIDWFTVGAQVLNFVFLVWLMKHFLYRPVLDAIAAREKRIASQVADAAKKQAQAVAERQTFEEKNSTFDKQRSELLAKATADAAAEGKRLAEEAQKAAGALAEKRQQALAAQASQLQQLLAARAAREVFAVARKTLADLAGADLEARMAEAFARRLSELSGAARDQLGTAFKQGGESAMVRSRFELSADQQSAIQKAIKTEFSTDAAVRFETVGDALCGIELNAGGQKLSWTIDSYLRDLENEVSSLLVPAPKPVAAATRTDSEEPSALAKPVAV